ncbi:unnamed protein product [Gulo gulo]|uniref:RANGRF n=1 Tax=Gulo gulo TaxID=48420 RepID=A0A9X9LQH2_GULGU|nr:unnamed protein product [Gulo gulo]
MGGPEPRRWAGPAAARLIWAMRTPRASPYHRKYHFEDVGGVQGARAVQVDTVQPLLLENLALRSCCQEAWVLSGKQQVAKENHQVAKDVTVHQALLRLPQYQTDLLLTFNDPPPDHRLSLGPENLSLPPWSLGDFEQLVTSLTLHDPNIFGPQ